MDTSIVAYDIIDRVVEEIGETEGDGVVSVVINQTTDGVWCSSIVCVGENDKVYPLFDPQRGEECLAATGITPMASLNELKAKLARWF